MSTASTASTADHRDRVLAAMGDVGVDVLLLGREANARYVSGADRLWLAGTRPFAPGCVVVRSTGAVHVLSITDDGLPPDLTPDRLYPISWSPLAMLEHVASIDGVGDARRIGVDGMTPMFEQVIGAVLGQAELVDAESILRTVRHTKSPDDVTGIVAAVDAAEMALAATARALRPGTTELQLQAVYEEAMTAADLTAPAFEGTFCVAEPGAVPRTFATDRLIIAGDPVHVRAGVMRDGFEGVVARTLVCGGDPVRSPLLDGTVARCTPGARVGDVRAAPADVDGTGMGHEELFDDDVLAADMVVAMAVLVDGVLDGAVVHVTADGPRRLGS
jgi:Xaa-Pro aminopeptidase